MLSQRKKTIWTFAGASFLHDLGSDMVFSVWPLFVTQFLGANVAILGLLDGVGDAAVSISQAVSGYWSDKLKKRKIFVLLGYSFGGIARIGYALSPSWIYLFPFRLLDRSGKLRGAPRDAIIAEVSQTTNRAKHFGILRMMDNFGAVLGILLAMVLLEKLGYRNMFLLAALPSFIAVILIKLLIHEQKGESKKLFRGMRFHDLSQDLRLYIILSAIFALGTFSYSFLLLYANTHGFQTATVPILYLLFTVVAAVTSVPFGRLADRIGRKPVLFLSFFFWAVVSTLVIFSPSLPGIVLAFMFFGLYNGALDPVQKTFVSELAHKDYVASSLGGFQMVVGIVSLPASLIAGLLWQYVGSTVPFMFSLLLTFLAGILLLFVKERKNHSV